MPQLYFGIDWGTTNSVAAWGQKNKDGKFITRAVDLRVLDERKVPRRKTILPSCVYFGKNFGKEGEPPIVGDYARTMLSTQSRRVIKSVKSLMGTDAVFMIDDEKLTPADVSSYILRQIAVSSREFSLGANFDDAVITVPASFDTDQKGDTIKAAELAGFRVKEEDGSPRNLLLNEPIAALYDFLNRQDTGETPPMLDLSSPKVILVFDIGGGTLDVSLHSVRRSPSDTPGMLPYLIEHYAISRHTLLGGDNFDLLLQKFLMGKVKGVDINSLNETRAELFRSEFLAEAEAAKIALNSQVENYRMLGQDYGNLTYDVMMNFIANTALTFEYTLSVDEYRKIMEPYLAHDLTMKSLDDFDSLSGRTENIIYPILDVLHKTRENRGNIPAIDAVLMNGGMSKLFAVRERIQEFFGFPPLEVGDPDLAVARGASVYHYWLHMGVKVPEIQNDDIGIELQGGNVFKLVKAGASLPFESEAFEFAVPEEGMTWLDLPFYKGTRNDTQPPNRRIASRRIHFSSAQPEGTPIDIKASVNEAGMLTLKVWNHDTGEIYPVSNVYTDRTEAHKPLVEFSAPGGFVKKPVAPIVQTGERRDIANLMRQYTKTGNEFYVNTTVPFAAGIYSSRLKELEAKIESASNSGEAVAEMSGLMTSYHFLAGRAARMLGRLGRVADPKSAYRARQNLEAFSSPKVIRQAMRNDDNRNRKLEAHAMAIQALSILYRHLQLLGEERPDDERTFIDLVNLKPFPNEAPGRELCYALGRTGYSPEALTKVSQYLTSSRTGEKIAAYWAMGRIASRERHDKCPASLLEEMLPSMFRNLNLEDHTHILGNGVYAIGEMCDQRIPGEKVSPRMRNMADDFLSLLAEKLDKNVIAFLKTSLNMIRGTELSTEQKEHLLTIRTANQG